ncbi:unnamed protein product [Rodentolepis nana]|uniref:C-CAP/cofactor C-like domain-containing protein n=1 Tax=Rodentolepis nana TaxID=102285 RepID=A0A158QHN1_RODNA|nr:unnamed protein product [Rodentolepis nana]
MPYAEECRMSYCSSIFIRYSNDCVILAACQQFRVRDSESISAFIASVSEPIIENSKSILFGPFQLSYPQINVQFRAAGLNPFNCSYSSIHDFSSRGNTPRNYDFLNPLSEVKICVLLPQHLDPTDRTIDGMFFLLHIFLSLHPVLFQYLEVLQRLKSLQATLDPNLSIVPPTYSGLLINPSPDGGFALIGLFFHIGVEGNARQLIKRLYDLSVYLVRSRCLQYSREDITRIFGDSTLAKHSALGPVIMLQFYGPPGIAVGQVCQGVGDELVGREHIEPPTLIHVTLDSTTASKQADMLSHFPVSRA